MSVQKMNSGNGYTCTFTPLTQVHPLPQFPNIGNFAALQFMITIVLTNSVPAIILQVNNVFSAMISNVFSAMVSNVSIQ